MLNIEQFFLVNHLSISGKTGLDSQGNANPNSKGGASLEKEKKQNKTVRSKSGGTRD